MLFAGESLLALALVPGLITAWWSEEVVEETLRQSACSLYGRPGRGRGPNAEVHRCSAADCRPTVLSRSTCDRDMTTSHRTGTREGT